MVLRIVERGVNETLPEELKVFDEVDAIFYLGSQTARQRVVRVGPETEKRYNDRSEFTVSAIHYKQQHFRNIIQSREVYSIQNYGNCSHRGTKNADYAGSAFP